MSGVIKMISNQQQQHQTNSLEVTNNSLLVASGTTSEELNFTAFIDLCRFCSIKMGPRLNLFEKEAEQRQLLFKIRTVLPIAIAKEDFLPKKVCERCVNKIEQFFEWRTNCVQTENIFKNYAESMRNVTATINFQVSYWVACSITILSFINIDVKFNLMIGRLVF